MPAFDRANTVHVLDHAATVIGYSIRVWKSKSTHDGWYREMDQGHQPETRSLRSGLLLSALIDL
jgi:hypothetical protein